MNYQAASEAISISQYVILKLLVVSALSMMPHDRRGARIPVY